VKSKKLNVKNKEKQAHLATGNLGAALAIFIFVSSLYFVPVKAQDQCGIVSSIAFPVDPAAFHIVQGFGVPSPRHQGRYHVGEDYYGGRGLSYGQPVHAIADGRVTYSATTGWGRDGGVVIIEHNFPDGSIAYSMYGHMEQTDTNQFPARYSCVKGGDVVGVVGNARPAPHLHFEIRLNQPDVPGPGYSPELPSTLGWRQASQFVLNWGTWLLPAHAWHLETGAPLIAPPLEMSDHSLLFLDSTRLRDSTPDGRVLWRINLEKAAVGLSEFEGSPLLIYADGTMQPVNVDGTLGESWTTGITVDSPPLSVGDLLLFHTPDNRLVALGADLETIVWQLENVPPIRRAFSSPNVIGLMTDSGEMLSISPDGRLLDQAQLTGLGSMTLGTGGNLLAYTAGGLWQIDTAGAWALTMESVPPGGESSAVLAGTDGRLFLLSGEDTPTLHAYNVDNSLAWEISLPEVGGAAELAQYGNVLLLTTTFGNIIAVQAESGALCNRTQVYGDARAQLWHSMGDDGVLRIAVSEQILGLNWSAFIGGCKA
jgi:murein DD-endopeptidase MepM/ murein hydrolase activator NlpD